MTELRTGSALRLNLEPTATAASFVRRELRRVTDGTAWAARLDDAQLAATELVTNAVLHGRAPITVTITLDADRLRVAVTDSSAVSPSFSLLDPTAVTGRGLMLVSSVADHWGVEPQADGKTVWMELAGARPSAAEEADIEALLSSWGDELGLDPALEQVRVVLTDLDVALLAAAEGHAEAALRELTLAAQDDGTDPGLRETAHQVLAAAATFEGVRAEVKRQLAAAVARRCSQLDIEVRLMRGDAELVRDYAHAADRADRLCVTGELLLEPPSAEAVSVRRDYLHRILAQLGS